MVSVLFGPTVEEDLAAEREQAYVHKFVHAEYGRLLGYRSPKGRAGTGSKRKASCR